MNAAAVRRFVPIAVLASYTAILAVTHLRKAQIAGEKPGLSFVEPGFVDGTCRRTATQTYNLPFLSRCSRRRDPPDDETRLMASRSYTLEGAAREHRAEVTRAILGKML
jgi:hypothetical protein